MMLQQYHKAYKSVIYNMPTSYTCSETLSALTTHLKLVFHVVSFWFDSVPVYVSHGTPLRHRFTTARHSYNSNHCRQPYGSSSSLINIKEYLQCRQPCNFGISLLLTLSVELWEDFFVWDVKSKEFCFEQYIMSRGKTNCRFASKHVPISLLLMHIIIKLKKCVEARRELRRTAVLLAVKQVIPHLIA